MNDQKLKFIPEPQLEFANRQCEEHPKDGLFLYGPIPSPSAGGILKYGVIATDEGIRLFAKWQKSVQGYIPPFKENVAHHSAFPGFQAAFGLKWSDAPLVELALDSKEIANSIRIRNRHEAIKKTVDIFTNAIASHLNKDADVAPDVWFVVVPTEVYLWGRPKKAPPLTERTIGGAKLKGRDAKVFLRAPSLFEEDNQEALLQLYDLNFHNQLKARLLSKAVVQIVKESTLDQATWPEARASERTVQDPATIAWNLCTTTYFKSSGPPWRIRDIRQGVCYVGIVFKKDHVDPESRNACCGAQLFLRSGDGLVFRGAVGPWYSKELKQCHLPREKAHELMSLVIEGYKNVHGEAPNEIFIHGRTRFDKNEWEGFKDAATGSTKIIGIRIRGTEDLKLYRLAKQPPVRGTYYEVNDRMAYLWTKGYVARFNTYPGFEVPNPLAINIDWGKSSIAEVVADILALTKVNFNGCTFSDGLPVTLKFADAIGEILTAAPNLEGAPQPFKYYI
ncbi:MAG: hypothetical protein ING44_03145 [Telmatospirillum sp.]|nr:hypothetical protein [Telmatospirillum sp.]